MSAAQRREQQTTRQRGSTRRSSLTAPRGTGLERIRFRGVRFLLRTFSWQRSDGRSSRQAGEEVQRAAGDDGALVGEEAQQHRQQLQVQAQLVRLERVPPAIC